MAYEILQTCLLVPDVSVNNCSGWVQAWGSLIGLLIAILLPARQRCMETKQKRLAERDRAQVTGIAIAMQLLHVSEIVRSLLSKLDDGKIPESLDLMRAALLLRQLVPTEGQVFAIQPVHHKLAVLLAQLRVTVPRAASDAELLADKGWQGKFSAKQLDRLVALFKGVNDSAAAAEQHLTKFLKETGTLSPKAGQRA